MSTKPVDTGSSDGFPPSTAKPDAGPIAAEPSTVATSGLIGDAVSTTDDLSEAAPNQDE